MNVLQGISLPFLFSYPWQFVMISVRAARFGPRDFAVKKRTKENGRRRYTRPKKTWNERVRPSLLLFALALRKRNVLSLELAAEREGKGRQQYSRNKMSLLLRRAEMKRKYRPHFLLRCHGKQKFSLFPGRD